ncbi:adenosine deaminase domain-containing protein 2 [Synchiropus splendidus]|uniref:adenosine deaminase domain-containing protein 2 n=1 Tax=Synchiropus splendidus TaxID=270530 RepID=UPI00237DF9DD|nr:adenosine deaminase domain-containing protein 2 [Synchiropus splendidus]
MEVKDRTRFNCRRVAACLQKRPSGLNWQPDLCEDKADAASSEGLFKDDYSKSDPLAFKVDCSPFISKLQNAADDCRDDKENGKLYEEVDAAAYDASGESTLVEEEEEILLDQAKEPEEAEDEAPVWLRDWHKDHMAAISSDTFDSLLKEFPDFQDCKSDMAAFVLITKMSNPAGPPFDSYEVVAVGAGGFSGTKWLCYDGTMLFDCHAIVIARRALQRFLYKHLLLFFDADPKTSEISIFQRSDESHLLQLKPNISLHLYTNQCPEGAVKNIYSEDGCSWTPMNLKYHYMGQLVSSAYLHPNQWAAKICCMSGSDKMCLWTVIGLQGSSLTHFIHPVYITSWVLGCEGQSSIISDLINKRVGDDWESLLPVPYQKQNIVFLSGRPVGPAKPSIQPPISINWCHGDEDVELVDSNTGLVVEDSRSEGSTGGSSRLCKGAFYCYFRKVAQLAGHQHLQALATYRCVKMDAFVYQTVKAVVKDHLMSHHEGPWQSKYIVDCFSA